MRGRQPLGTELCGLDRAGRQTQHAKSSGPFEMSRQEARLREKQGHSPHTRAAKQAAVTASEAQRISPLGSECQLRHILIEVKGMLAPAQVQQGCADRADILQMGGMKVNVA